MLACVCFNRQFNGYEEQHAYVMDILYIVVNLVVTGKRDLPYEICLKTNRFRSWRLFTYF